MLSYHNRYDNNLAGIRVHDVIKEVESYYITLLVHGNIESEHIGKRALHG